MHSPGTKHRQQAVKRLFCYLSGTKHLGLFYPKGGSLPPDLHAFLNFDWASCYDTRVSTSGFCFMLGNSYISWLSKKQPTMATCSCEAEYRGQLSQLWLSVFGSDPCGLIWVLSSHLPPPSSLTVRAHWQLLRGTQCSMLALSTLRCTIIMAGRRGSLQARPVWHMCQHRITLLIFSQRHCLVRSSKLFAKLWAYYHLWIDHPYGLALPYTLSASSCS